LTTVDSLLNATSVRRSDVRSQGSDDEFAARALWISTPEKYFRSYAFGLLKITVFTSSSEAQRRVQARFRAQRENVAWNT